MKDNEFELHIEALTAECDGYTSDGIFIEPKNIPDGIDTDDWTTRQREVWEGRFYILENDRHHYSLFCFDGGCWDRATLKGHFETVESACEGARNIADAS